MRRERGKDPAFRQKSDCEAARVWKNIFDWRCLSVYLLVSQSVHVFPICLCKCAYVATYKPRCNIQKKRGEKKKEEK
jgi:hypothetical protein